MSTESDSGAQMSLNGNLEVFPLEEVLRLLARSRKSGCLRVETAGVQGRIFLTNGALSVATTANDVELRQKLIASGLVDESDIRKIELSGASVADSLSDGVSGTQWADFVREESVEGLYRIRRPGRGAFDFVVDLNPRYRTGQSFDSEVILSEADRRALEWEDIETVLPGLDLVVRMVPRLEGEEAVTLSPATWQILAALSGGSSTRQVAAKLIWSEFYTAREMAALVRNGLVTVSEHELDTDVRPEPVLVPEEETVEAEEVVETVEDSEPTFSEDAPAAWGSEPAAAAADDVEEFEELEPDQVPAATLSESDEWGPETEELEEAAEAHVPEEHGESFWGEEPAAETAAETEVEVEVEVAEQAQDAPPEAADAPAASWWSDEPARRDGDEEPESQWGASPWTAEAPAEEAVIAATPWGSPVTDAGDEETIDEFEPETQDPEAGADEPAASIEDEPGSSESHGEPDAAEDAGRTQGWWAETMGAAEEPQPDSDSEADRFLESVFSSLSGPEEESAEAEDGEETGFGMGLLRRRRLGASARDLDNDR